MIFKTPVKKCHFPAFILYKKISFHSAIKKLLGMHMTPIVLIAIYVNSTRRIIKAE